MTLLEMKAYAYDCIANMEFWQKELTSINQQIAELSRKEQPEQPEQPEFEAVKEIAGKEDENQAKK